MQALLTKEEEIGELSIEFELKEEESKRLANSQFESNVTVLRLGLRIVEEEGS